MGKGLLFGAMLGLFSFLSAGNPGFADEVSLLRNPLGELANYSLDKGRSTSLIKSGLAKTEVIKLVPGSEGKPAEYQVKLDFDLNITFVGRKKETVGLMVLEEFFTPEFMVKLRETGLYEGEKFHVKYLGKAEARTMNGEVYKQCDKIQLYNIKLEEGSPFRYLLAQLMESESISSREILTGELDDLVIGALVKEGVPVFGAVKIDVKGRLNNRYDFKAGFDLTKR